MSQEPFSLDEFGGTARLFPLPNLVLFPHVAWPLHIFEPRYRQMVADALDDDRLIALALLRPGWEKDYLERPAICPVVCLGRIYQEERLADGRYNLLLQGLCRARVREELQTDRLYRVARIDLLPDVPVSVPAVEQDLREMMGTAVAPFFAGHMMILEELGQLLASSLSLGCLCDIFCSVMPLALESKQELLEETGVENRVRLLLRRLENCPPPPKQQTSETPPRRFPPEFSSN
jgi:Lon protease-like protein